MTIQSNNQPSYTIQEYLNLEQKAIEKHEFHNGTVQEMPGGKYEQNQIGANLITSLNIEAHTKTEIIRVCTSDMKVYIPEKNLFVYPDVLAILGDLKFYQNRREVVLNPIIVAEVLSKSTQKYDQTTKLAAYQTIDSLKDCLLIYQDQFKIVHWFKNKKEDWSNCVYDHIEDKVFIDSLDISISLKSIYKYIDLEEI